MAGFSTDSCGKLSKKWGHSTGFSCSILTAGPGTFSPRLAEHTETFSSAHLAPVPLCGATSHAESFREGRLEMILAFSAELKKPASEAQSDLPGFCFAAWSDAHEVRTIRFQELLVLYKHLHAGRRLAWFWQSGEWWCSPITGVEDIRHYSACSHTPCVCVCSATRYFCIILLISLPAQGTVTVPPHDELFDRGRWSRLKIAEIHCLVVTCIKIYQGFPKVCACTPKHSFNTGPMMFWFLILCSSCCCCCFLFNNNSILVNHCNTIQHYSI